MTPEQVAELRRQVVEEFGLDPKAAARLEGETRAELRLEVRDLMGLPAEDVRWWRPRETPRQTDPRSRFYWLAEGKGR